MDFTSLVSPSSCPPVLPRPLRTALGDLSPRNDLDVDKAIFGLTAIRARRSADVRIVAPRRERATSNQRSASELSRDRYSGVSPPFSSHEARDARAHPLRGRRAALSRGLQGDAELPLPTPT